MFALELAAGFLRVTGTLVSRADPSLAVGPGVPVAVAVALTFAYFVGVGVFEELLFRGYLLTNVAEGLDGWFGVGRRGALAAAVALSSLAFAAGHWMNPNVTPLAVANIALFGTLFAASYLLTERIAVAIGFHVTWNFAIASVFGFPVSGFTTPATVVAVEQSGPELVTGGSFGPEGGLVALVAFAVGVAALGWWVRLREGRSGGGPPSRDRRCAAPWSRNREPTRPRKSTARPRIPPTAKPSTATRRPAAPNPTPSSRRLSQPRPSDRGELAHSPTSGKLPSRSGGNATTER
ncbi:CPBP family intramembrane glutamic endopeptidase [Halosimplex aquaticum]